MHIHVRRRQHAHIRLYQVPAAQTRILVVLQHVQQFGLQMHRHFGDFIQENCALVGQFKFSGLGSHCARERALLKSEKLRFQQFARQRRAVHLDKRLIPSLRPQMDHPRDNFLAHAAFSAHENRHVHRRNLQNLLPDAHHLRTGCKKTQILRHLIAVIAQRLVFLRQLLFLPRLQHRSFQVRLFERFCQIVVRTQPDRFHNRAHFV